jgi:hypothetical protein
MTRPVVSCREIISLPPRGPGREHGASSYTRKRRSVFPSRDVVHQQGLTLVQVSSSPKALSLGYTGRSQGSVTETAQVEVRSGRVEVPAHQPLVNRVCAPLGPVPSYIYFTTS